MREIEFRGQRKDNKEWVYGCLVGEKYIVCNWEINNDYGDETDFYATDFYEVIPETVGQYTGEKDKKCKEIYEGDILRCWDNDENVYLTIVVLNGGASVSYTHLTLP